jgi:hypothetical protein
MRSRDVGSGQSKGAREGDNHEPNRYGCQSARSHLNRLKWELEEHKIVEPESEEKRLRLLD